MERLTPDDVLGRRFQKRLRGYDVYQVQELLERAADELKLLRAAAATDQDGRPRFRYIPRLTAADVERTQFDRAVPGYAMGEVDAFLDRVVAELRRLQEGDQAAGAPGGPPPAARLTPRDIQRREFTKTLRGYAMGEVDAFLDRVTQEVVRLGQQPPEGGDDWWARHLPGPRLTAGDVRQRRFTVAMRGYARHEVDAFLDELAEELTRLAEEHGQPP